MSKKIKHKKEGNNSSVQNDSPGNNGKKHPGKEKQPEDPTINKDAKESGQRTHNDIEQDNES